MPIFVWIIAIICVFIAIVLVAYESSEARSAFSLGGIALGLAFGSLVFWYWSQLEHQGIPIAKFHNKDIYKIVSLDPVVDDSTVIIGMRRVGTFEVKSSHETPTDLELRVYRIPEQLVDPIKKRNLPIFVTVSKFQETVVFKPLSEKEIAQITK